MVALPSPKNVLTCETADRRADGTRLREQRRYWGSPSQESPKTTIDKKSSWTFGFRHSRTSFENDVSSI